MIKAFIRAARATEELMRTMNHQPNLKLLIRSGPDERGHFGIFGGRFVAETLDAADPRSGKGLYRGQGRSGVSRPR